MNSSIQTSLLARAVIVTALLSLALFFSNGSCLAADTSTSTAQPLDLTAQYNAPASVLTNINSFPAWKTAAFGHQVFHGVPFQIGGALHLWGTGSGTSSPYPEGVSNIVVNRKFPTLYICHGSYYKTPDDTPVFKVILRYDDASSQTNTLCFGDDILDWKVSGKEAPLRTPSGTNSMLAWIGGEFSPQEKSRLRYCLTILDNPHPDRLVATIDLLSCKTRTVPFILGMTTGPSGLAK